MVWIQCILIMLLMSVMIYGQYMIYKTLQEIKVEKLLKLIEKVGEWV
jgi:hypothetical protein